MFLRNVTLQDIQVQNFDFGKKKQGQNQVPATTQHRRNFSQESQEFAGIRRSVACMPSHDNDIFIIVLWGVTDHGD